MYCTKITACLINWDRIPTWTKWYLKSHLCGCVGTCGAHWCSTSNTYDHDTHVLVVNYAQTLTVGPMVPINRSSMFNVKTFINFPYIYNHIYNIIIHYITFIATNSRHPHGIYRFVSKIMDSNGSFVSHITWSHTNPHVPRSKVGVSPRMGMLGRRSQQWCTTVAKRTVAPAVFVWMDVGTAFGNGDLYLFIDDLYLLIRHGDSPSLQSTRMYVWKRRSCHQQISPVPANIPRSMVIKWGNDHDDRGEDLPGVEGYITIFGFTLQWLLDWKQDD